MKIILFILALCASFSAPSFAGELDNEGSVTNKSLQGTLVVRLDNRTKEAAALQTSSTLASETQAQALVKQGGFQTVGIDKVRSELDQDGGASSWYFYCGNPYQYNNYNYSYSYVNWYGSWYTPYYTYSYGYYSYYYYSNSYWR